MTSKQPTISEITYNSYQKIPKNISNTFGGGNITESPCVETSDLTNAISVKEFTKQKLQTEQFRWWISFLILKVVTFQKSHFE